MRTPRVIVVWLMLRTENTVCSITLHGWLLNGANVRTSRQRDTTTQYKRAKAASRIRYTTLDDDRWRLLRASVTFLRRLRGKV
jgi:hypothetical protein